MYKTNSVVFHHHALEKMAFLLTSRGSQGTNGSSQGTCPGTCPIRKHSWSFRAVQRVGGPL